MKVRKITCKCGNVIETYKSGDVPCPKCGEQLGHPRIRMDNIQMSEYLAGKFTRIAEHIDRLNKRMNIVETKLGMHND